MPSVSVIGVHRVSVGPQPRMTVVHPTAVGLVLPCSFSSEGYKAAVIIHNQIVAIIVILNPGNASVAGNCPCTGSPGL